MLLLAGFLAVGSQPVFAQSCSGLTISGAAGGSGAPAGPYRITVGQAVNITANFSFWGSLRYAKVNNLGDICGAYAGCATLTTGILNFGSGFNFATSQAGYYVFEINAYESDKCEWLCTASSIFYQNNNNCLCDQSVACFTSIGNCFSTGCRKYLRVLPLSCPTINSADCSGGNVNLQWSAVTGAAKYQVMRDGVNIWQGSWTSFLDTTATCGVNHSYDVYPVDALGGVNSNCDQNAIANCTCSCSPLAAPSNINVNPSSQYQNPVLFTWNYAFNDATDDTIFNILPSLVPSVPPPPPFTCLDQVTHDGSAERLQEIILSSEGGTNFNINLMGQNTEGVACDSCTVDNGVDCCLAPAAGVDFSWCVACRAPKIQSVVSTSCAGLPNGSLITWTDNSGVENGFAWYRGGVWWKNQGPVVAGTYTTTDCTSGFPFGTIYGVRCFTNACPVPIDGAGAACSLNLDPSTLNLASGENGKINALLTIQNGDLSDVQSSPCSSSNVGIASVSPLNPTYSPNPATLTVTGNGSTGQSAVITCTVQLNSGGACSGSTTVNIQAPAWYQTREGDVHAEGNLSSRIRATATAPYFSLEAAGGFPGVVSYGGSYANFGSGWVAREASERWLAQSSFGSPALMTSYFDYFYQLLDRPTASGLAGPGITSANLPGGSGGVIYFNHDVLTSGAWNIGDKKIVVLVDGNFLIQDAINVGANGSLIVVSSKDMGVNQSINPSIRGIFITDEAFVSGAYYSVGGTFTRAPGSNLRLIINGTVVSRGNIELNRDLLGTNATTPAESFLYDAGLFINSYPGLWQERFTWEEIAP